MSGLTYEQARVRFTASRAYGYLSFQAVSYPFKPIFLRLS